MHTSIAILLSALAIGQSDYVSGPLLPYHEAYADAVRRRMPLVVGVGCMPAPGRYESTLVSRLDGFKGPCIVLMRPHESWMIWTATLPPTASAATISRYLAPAPKVDLRDGILPKRKYNPDEQQNFQERVRRWGTSMYSTPAFRAGQC